MRGCSSTLSSCHGSLLVSISGLQRNFTIYEIKYGHHTLGTFQPGCLDVALHEDARGREFIFWKPFRKGATKAKAKARPWAKLMSADAQSDVQSEA